MGRSRLLWWNRRSHPIIILLALFMRCDGVQTKGRAVFAGIAPPASLTGGLRRLKCI